MPLKSVQKTKLLSIFGGNAKLKRGVGTFSLPAGHSCPGAKDCLAKADRQTGKLFNGKDQKFRCFAATSEAVFPSVRKSRWQNFEMLQDAETFEGMRDLIDASVKASGFYAMRVHVSGDFFNRNYFNAWLAAAELNPEVRFYAYTKAIDLWVERQFVRKLSMPTNFRLIASRGGRHDRLIDKHDLVSAEVVFHPDEAFLKGLKIDHDDSLAMGGEESFALLIHGMQAAGSAAGAAQQKLRKEGVAFAYSENA